MFLRDLYRAYADAPRIQFRHLAKHERNAEIVRRYGEGETLAALAMEFGVSDQRIWRLVRQYAENRKE